MNVESQLVVNNFNLFVNSLQKNDERMKEKKKNVIQILI